MNGISKSELLTIKQVQEILGVSRATVYDFINDEKNPLPVIYLTKRTPRIKAAELEKWIEKQEELNQL